MFFYTFKILFIVPPRYTGTVEFRLCFMTELKCLRRTDYSNLEVRKTCQQKVSLIRYIGDKSCLYCQLLLLYCCKTVINRVARYFHLRPLCIAYWLANRDMFLGNIEIYAFFICGDRYNFRFTNFLTIDTPVIQLVFVPLKLVHFAFVAR